MPPSPAISTPPVSCPASFVDTSTLPSVYGVLVMYPAALLPACPSKHLHVRDHSPLFPSSRPVGINLPPCGWLAFHSCAFGIMSTTYYILFCHSTGVPLLFGFSRLTKP